MSCEEVDDLGLGPEVDGVAGGGFSKGPPSLVPKSRAQEGSSLENVRE